MLKFIYFFAAWYSCHCVSPLCHHLDIKSHTHVPVFCFCYDGFFHFNFEEIVRPFFFIQSESPCAYARMII